MLKVSLFDYLRKDIGDGYPTSSFLPYSWAWGSICGIVFSLQIVTGILLAEHYTANVDLAFSSIQLILREVNYGWLLLQLHSNGASFFFFAMYMHIGRNLYYGLFRNNIFAWVSGLIIFLLAMACAFIGYVLPWGQMSFWGATVITNLFSAIPVVGQDLVYWLWAGFSVGDPTLSKFFSLHYVLPFLILGVVIIHLFYLHAGYSSNPLGVGSSDKIPFYPYFVLKDAVGLIAVFFFFIDHVIERPLVAGHSDNHIEANPLVTPSHIVPEWYFLPFYAILRAVPNKSVGVALMFSAILILFTLPHIGQSKSLSSRFYFFSSFFWYKFAANFLILLVLGKAPTEDPYVSMTLGCTVVYFFQLLVVLPEYKYVEKIYSCDSSDSSDSDDSDDAPEPAFERPWEIHTWEGGDKHWFKDRKGKMVYGHPSEIYTREELYEQWVWMRMNLTTYMECPV